MERTRNAARGVERRTASEAARVENDPNFQALVKERSAFAWTLSIIVVAVYLVFILLVAFDRSLMAMKIGDGPTSLGIVLGLAVILFAFAVTGIYVARANGRFDELTARIKGGL